jgi:hypothetical protein
VTTLYSSLLHTRTSVHSQVFTRRCSVTVLTADVPHLLVSRAISVPQLQDFNGNSFTTEPQQSSNCPAYDISARTAQETPFHYWCAIAMETSLFVKPLLNNGSFKAASLPSNGSICHNIKRENMNKFILLNSEVKCVNELRSHDEML